MKNIIHLFLGFFLFVPLAQAHLSNEFMDRYHIYRLSQDSEFFREIEDVTTDIVLNSGFSFFCDLLWSPEVTRHLTGLSESQSLNLYKSCGHHRQTNHFAGEITKTFQREYYVAYDPKGLSPVQSWTTYDNKTLIFVDQNLTWARLRNILAHELAISVDGKNGMMYGTYLSHQRASRKHLTNKERQLQHRFNLAAHRQISFALAALRATVAEQMMLDNIKHPLVTLDHSACRQAFLSIYYVMKKNPELTLGKGGDGFNEMLASSMDSIAETFGMENSIKEILDETLTFNDEDKKVTFCTYMSRPLFSAKSAYSFMAAGPRPKVTGGWLRSTDEKTIRIPKESQNIYDRIQKDLKNGKVIKIEKLRSST